MSISVPQGRYTGLLGYSRNFENFGMGLPFRVVEKFSYEIYDNKLNQGQDLSSYFKAQFAAYLGIVSGDVNITSFSNPQSKDSKEDGVRFQKYTVTLETRSVGNNYQHGAYENTKLTGISGVIANYYDLFKDISEDFGFDASDGGDKSYKHNLSFSLRTGAGYTTFDSLKTVAANVATSLFDVDGDAGLSKIGFRDYADYAGADAQVYYNETYDSLKNSFSFEKTRKVLDNISATYNHNMAHVITYDTDGYFKVEEKLKVFGKLSYQQALNGFLNLAAGSRGRCEAVMTGYFPLTYLQTQDSSVTNAESLTLTSTTKTCNVPNIYIEGSLSYTNNPAYISGFMRNGTVSINKLPNGAIEMEHGVEFSLNSHITGRTDTLTVSGTNNMVQTLALESTNSPSYCRSIYHTLTGITGLSPSGIVRTKSQFSAPQRGKNYKASFSYSDSPIYSPQYQNPYNGNLVTGFTQLEVTVEKTTPQDVIQEYKVINRPTQQTVLSYGYQQEMGKASVSYKGILNRRGNTFESFYAPTGEVTELVANSQQLFLNRVLLGADMFNFYMTSAKYDFDSENNCNISVEYSFTKKK